MDILKKKSYKEIKVKSALNKLKRKIPYSWDLNIFRGCQHNCQYCYAMYSHKYLGSKDFFNDIYVKTNIVDRLEEELKANSWKKEVINIGGVTDSYQAAEEKYKLMPDILKLLIKYKTPAIISTKSSLILRDYELIDKLSNITYVNVAATITTLSDNIRRIIEPGSEASDERFEVLKEFGRTNASTGLHIMPIIPLLTDDEYNIEQMLIKAKECNVDYVLTGTLYLKGKTRKHFMKLIQEKFPFLYPEFKSIYKTGGADKSYKNKLYKMVNRLRSKYCLSSSYMRVMREKLAETSKQKSLHF